MKSKLTPEQIYDRDIAPKLLKISKQCEKLGFSMVASVAWEPASGETGRTECYQPNTHCNQTLVHWAARCNGNVDKLIMAIDRHAKEHGHSSIYLQMLGNKNVKYSGNETAAITITTKASQ